MAIFSTHFFHEHGNFFFFFCNMAIFFLCNHGKSSPHSMANLVHVPWQGLDLWGRRGGPHSMANDFTTFFYSFCILQINSSGGIGYRFFLINFLNVKNIYSF